jgi:MerT mercuric transport protein
MRPRLAVTGSVLAGAAAALGASACCAGPLLLVVLGVGGAWGSRLTALQPFQPLFVAVSSPSSRWPSEGSTPGPKNVRRAKSAWCVRCDIVSASFSGS